MGGITFFPQLLGYSQIEKDGKVKDGWKFYSYFNRKIVKDKGIVASPLDYLLVSLSEYFGHDFTPVADHWGLQTNASSRSMAAKNPHLTKKIWEYNPVLTERQELPDYDGKVSYTSSGEMPFRHDRTDWSVVAYSSKDPRPDRQANMEEGIEARKFLYYNYKKNASTAYNLIDGSASSVWESYSDPWEQWKETINREDEGLPDTTIVHYPYKGDEYDRDGNHSWGIYSLARTPELPYYIVIKPDIPLEKMNGFYMINGNQDNKWLYDKTKWSYVPKDIEVQVLTGLELDFQEEDSTFTNLSQVENSWKTVYKTDDQYLPDKRNLYYIDLKDNGKVVEVNNVTGIRLVFRKPTHYAADKPADFDNDKYPKRPDKANRYLDRIHKFAEFGTYYY